MNEIIDFLVHIELEHGLDSNEKIAMGNVIDVIKQTFDLAATIEAADQDTYRLSREEEHQC